MINDKQFPGKLGWMDKTFVDLLFALINGPILRVAEVEYWKGKRKGSTFLLFFGKSKVKLALVFVTM